MAVTAETLYDALPFLHAFGILLDMGTICLFWG